MNGRRWLATVAVVGVVGFVVSGSRGGAEDDPQSDTFRDARVRVDSILVSLDARLAGLEAKGANLSAGEDPALAIDRLRERGRSIDSAMSTLEGAPPSERDGSLAGLRASLADLEHRVDLAELMHAEDLVLADSLLDHWLHDADRRIASAERLIADSAAAIGFRDPVRVARLEHGRLQQRFTIIHERSAGDLASRQSLGRDIAEVRRHIRATIRSIPARYASGTRDS